MSVSQICRFSETLTRELVFANSIGQSEWFVLAQHGGAILMVNQLTSGAGSTSTLKFHIKRSTDAAETFEVADSANAVVTLTIQAGRCYQLPDELFAASYVTATTGTAGHTARCFIQMKG